MKLTDMPMNDYMLQGRGSGEQEPNLEVFEFPQSLNSAEYVSSGLTTSMTALYLQCIKRRVEPFLCHPD